MVHARHTCTPFRPWICVASRKESGRHMGVCLHAVMRVCELHIYRSMESSAGGCLQPENCRSRHSSAGYCAEPSRDVLTLCRRWLRPVLACNTVNGVHKRFRVGAHRRILSAHLLHPVLRLRWQLFICSPAFLQQHR